MRSTNAPLEKKRPLLFAAGLLIAFSVTLVSFEWRTPYRLPVVDPGTNNTDDLPYELPPITTREVTRPVLKIEPVVPMKNTTEFVIVDNEVDREVGKDVFIPELVDEIPGPTMEKSHEADVVEPEFFKIVEEMPTYPGGDKAILKFLAKHTDYPRIARENNISGVVYVSYIVDRDGKVKDVKVERSVDPSLDREAVRVVKTLKGYKPGKQRGKPVPVQFTVPIRFVLAN